MGKQTRNHPVSLNVIRGAAEFGGFKLGKLRQLSYDEQFNVGYYKTDVLAIPDNCHRTPNEILGRLNDMYSQDVLFTLCSLTSGGSVLVRFMTGSFDRDNPPVSVEEAVRLGIVNAEDIPF